MLRHKDKEKGDMDMRAGLLSRALVLLVVVGVMMRPMMRGKESANARGDRNFATPRSKLSIEALTLSHRRPLDTDTVWTPRRRELLASLRACASIEWDMGRGGGGG